MTVLCFEVWDYTEFFSETELNKSKSKSIRIYEVMPYSQNMTVVHSLIHNIKHLCLLKQCFTELVEHYPKVFSFSIKFVNCSACVNSISKR